MVVRGMGMGFGSWPCYKLCDWGKSWNPLSLSLPVCKMEAIIAWLGLSEIKHKFLE